MGKREENLETSWAKVIYTNSDAHGQAFWCMVRFRLEGIGHMDQKHWPYTAEKHARRTISHKHVSHSTKNSSQACHERRRQRNAFTRPCIPAGCRSVIDSFHKQQAWRYDICQTLCRKSSATVTPITPNHLRGQSNPCSQPWRVMEGSWVGA